MNRLAASQKSSRTSTIAWTCSPSHCRRAATSSVFSSPRLAWSHCSNWSSTSSTFCAREATTRPRRKFASESTSPDPRGSSGHALRKPFEQPGLGLLRGRLDVNRQDVLAEPGQQPRLDQRRLAAARGTVDQPDLERQVGVGLLDPASSRTGCSRAGRRGREVREAAPGRSRHRAHRTIAALWGRS